MLENQRKKGAQNASITEKHDSKQYTRKGLEYSSLHRIAPGVRERTLTKHLPVRRFSISSAKLNNTRLVAEGYRNVVHVILPQTTKSVINGSLYNKTGIKLLESVETVTRDNITIHGDASVKITLAHCETETNVLWLKS